MSNNQLAKDFDIPAEFPNRRRKPPFILLWLIGFIAITTIAVISVKYETTANDDVPFITTWRVAGDSAGRTIIIPINSLLNQYAHLGPIVINFTIDWGDGSSVETFTNASLVGAPRISHTYTTPGDYQVKIRGDFPGFDMGALSGDARDNARKIISLDQWGKSKWRSMEHAFYYAENMIAKYTDQPDTSLVTNMHQAFAFARKFNGRINFDTRNVTNMSSMFHEANAFDSPITFSDTSKVTNMSGMFLGTTSFNQPINFNTSNVTNMGAMFQRTTRFNQPLNLDTRNVTNMANMFQQSGFNQPLNFNTSKVENMTSMFMSAPKFNQPLNFDTRNVKNMSAMFFNSPQNSPLNFSDTSQVTNMSMMFHLSKFNQPLNFDTRSVTNMDSMFSSSAFNQPVNFNGQSLVSTKKMFGSNQNFDSTVTISNATKLAETSGMFSGAAKFNQPITFTTSNVKKMDEMFKDATAFNQDISKLDYSRIINGGLTDFVSNSGISTLNNDKLIKRWRNQLADLGNQRPLSTSLRFCQAQTDRTFLISKGWIFSDIYNCSSYKKPPADIVLPANSFDENNFTNTHLANITVTNHPDDNPDDVNTVTLGCAVPGPDDNAFTVDGNRLIFKPVADYETKNSYTLCLRATDTANLFLDKNFTISVRDVNEAPTAQPQTFTVAENANIGTELGQIVAEDPDNGQTLSYEITSGNDLGILEINPTGKIRVKNNSNLDYEKTNHLNLVVKIKDSGTPILSTEVNITINITDINEAPIFTSVDSVVINEDQTSIHNLVAKDPENSPLTFSADNLLPWITLIDNQLTFNPKQDQVGPHQITIKVSDGQNTVSQAINLRVNNVNDLPVITSSPEIQATKFQLYKYALAASDEDGDNITFGVTKKPNWLNFNPSTGELSGTPGNNEAGKTYQIILTANDQFSSTEQTFNLEVLDKNYAPNINDQNFNLNENTPSGNEVYQIIAQDPDNHPLSYQIISGNTLDIFEVTSTGKLKIKNSAPLNYEAIQKIILRVKVSDNQSPSLSADAEITINIQDINEAPIFTSAAQIGLKHVETKTHTLTAIDPENDHLTFSATGLPAWISLNNNILSLTPSQSQIGDHEITVKVTDGTNTTTQTIKVKVLAGNVAPTIAPQTFTIAENTANQTEIAQIIATDFNTDDILSYELIGGNNLGIFELTTSGQLKVKDNTNLDYEQTTQVILTIKVSDNQSPILSNQNQITINISDINEAPVFISPDNTSLKHTESKTHTFIATDPENNPLIFSGSSLPFWISLSSSELTLTPSLAEVGNHQINIEVSDGTNTTTQVFHVTIIEENIPPSINPQTFDIAENSIDHTEVGQIIASDPNPGQSLTFEIIGGNSLNIFEVTPSGKLKIKDNTNLDFEQVQQLLLTIQIKDNGDPELSANASITINITDIDDQAPNLNLDTTPIVLKQGDQFNPPSATCHDQQSDCNLTIENPVNTNKPGIYQVTYTASDLAGNRTIAHLKVTVIAKSKPIDPNSNSQKPDSSTPTEQTPSLDGRPPFILKGELEISLNLNQVYHEPGFECTLAKNCIVEITGQVDSTKPGTYKIIYRSSHPAYSITRRVIVRDNIPAKDRDLFAVIWDFLGRYWFFIFVLPLLWWLLLLFIRRRREEEEEEK